MSCPGLTTTVDQDGCEVLMSSHMEEDTKGGGGGDQAACPRAAGCGEGEAETVA